MTDYLEKEGFLLPPDHGKEQRKYLRKKITLPATTLLRTDREVMNVPCVILDISMGGVLLTYPKGSNIHFPTADKLPPFELRFGIPQMQEPLIFDCDARRMHDTGKEIQIGATFRQPSPKHLRQLNDYFFSESRSVH